MSKSSEITKQAQAYILSCIDADAYNVEADTDAEKIQFLHDTFMSEYGWMVERVGMQKALAEYYAGLPTACTIAFNYSEILELAYKWGSLSEGATERQEEKIIDNWFNFMAFKTIQLFNKYKVRP